jgi:hypothetical protein
MAVGLALGVSGCNNRSLEQTSYSPLSLNDVATFAVEDTQISIGAVSGYCVADWLTQSKRAGYHAIIGGCAHFSVEPEGDRLFKYPVIISSYIARKKSKVSETGFTQAALQFGATTQSDAPFHVLDSSEQNGTVYLWVNYSTGSPLVGTEPTAVIALQSIKGYTVIHKIFRVTGAGANQNDGQRLAQEMVKRTRVLN